MTTVMGGAAATAKSSPKIKVCVSLAGYSTGFWAAYVQYEATFAKQDGLTLVGPESANGDAATQAAQIQTCINEKVNVLLVNPVDSAAISTSDALAKAHHIPVVMMDVGPSSAPKIYAVVRANNLTIGADAADYICKHAGGPSATVTGTAAVLQGDVQDATTALSTYSNLVGIYSSFSGPDNGIIAALQSAGKLHKVAFVETDGVPAELAAIRAGTLDAAVSQPVNLYAGEGLAYAKLAAQGKPAPKIGSKGLGGGTIVNLNGSAEDALPSTFVTSANASVKSLWGNTYTGP